MRSEAFGPCVIQKIGVQKWARRNKQEVRRAYEKIFAYARIFSIKLGSKTRLRASFWIVFSLPSAFFFLEYFGAPTAKGIINWYVESLFTRRPFLDVVSLVQSNYDIALCAIYAHFTWSFSPCVRYSLYFLSTSMHRIEHLCGCIISTVQERRVIRIHFRNVCVRCMIGWHNAKFQYMM